MCLDLANKGNISNLVDLLRRDPGRDILLKLCFDSELNCNSMKLHQIYTQGRDNIYITFHDLFEQL